MHRLLFTALAAVLLLPLTPQPTRALDVVHEPATAEAPEPAPETAPVAHEPATSQPSEAEPSAEEAVEAQAEAEPKAADAGEGEGMDESAEEEPEPSTYEEDEDGNLQVYDHVQVKQRADTLVGIASSASEGTTGAEDIAQRPISRPGEIAETTPGVIATQHSGGGKANQYFLRGFNLDHGTDFSVTVAGTPVNMPSHGHGQGYSDLNFLIPEMVDRVRYRKGPYSAETGDFSAAGSLDIDLIRTLDRPLFSATGGSHEYGRLLLAKSFEKAGGDLLAALDVSQANGPWTRGDDFDKANALLRYSRGDLMRGYSVTAMGYNGDWLSTDQVPRRAVDSGLIDRFDLIDPGPRGSTGRYSVSAEIHRGDELSLERLRAYVLHYDFDLISNFTYFLENPERGDQFEQADRRWVAGLDGQRQWVIHFGERHIEAKTGFDLRADRIDNGLFRTQNLERFETVRQDEILQVSGGPYAEALVHWSSVLRTRLGLRAQGYWADVDSNLAINSDSTDDALLSPKLSVILGPFRGTELYLNAGYGFHSNDARGATLRVDPTDGSPARRVQPLVRARGADIGLRTELLPGWVTTATVFHLELDSELVFVGDGGSTEASRPSRRRGVELTNVYRVSERLHLDLDYTRADSEFTDSDPAGNEIPGALEETVAAGIAFKDVGPWFGALRWRYFSGAPLIEDGSARSRSTSLINGSLGYAFPGGLSLDLQVFNLLDREDADITYFYESRLPGEPAGGIEDIHFHPVEDRSFRLVVTWRGR